MPENENNTNGYAARNDDEQEDMAAKGGPTTTLGQADAKHSIPHPYDDDTQTQLAAKSTEKKKDNE